MGYILNLKILIFLLFFLILLIPQLASAQAPCNLNAPMNLTTTPGPGVGQVTLRWNPVLNVDHYVLKYGLQADKYIFGAVNAGGKSANSFVVSSLKPDVRYFFRVGATNKCSSFSNEVSAMANKGAVLGVSNKPASRRYVVIEGDTLGSIAERFNSSILVICNTNKIQDPNFIFPGMMLSIP